MSNLTTGFDKVEAQEPVGCIHRHLEEGGVSFSDFPPDGGSREMA